MSISDEVIYESKDRPDFRDTHTPEGLRVVQISTNPTRNSQHMYPESLMFTSDSGRFVLHRSRSGDPTRGDYWLCDIEDDFGLRQLTDEANVHGRVAVSPDSKWMYYFVDRTRSEGILEVKRVSLETFVRESFFTLEGPIPGTNFRPMRPHGASSISVDGKRLCTYVRLDDGKTENLFGILVFSLEQPSVELIFEGEHFSNMHVQYCRSEETALSHDILIQHNHVDGLGADLHVIRDDGTCWRDVPIARDGVYRHTGHEQWRGTMDTVISSIQEIAGPRRHRLIESWPIAADDATSHLGGRSPGTRNNDITRDTDCAGFNHFHVDASGMHIVTRNERRKGEADLKFYIGTFSPGKDSVLKTQYLCSPKSPLSLEKQYGLYHGNKPRPFFSPDGRMVFFHSTVDGPCQVFMATGYAFPEF
ncbi:TolB family protein [Candidatus Poribacteria bacterium]